MAIRGKILLNVEDYLINPDKYVFPFVIKEKNKERTIITYNKGQYGSYLRDNHEIFLEWFNENIADRNKYSYAYHKGVRCADALKEHLKSNFFIKLDIHKFFESITEDLFFAMYGDYFNKKITKMIKACFYKGSLSIGFVTSPAISDYFMKGFDKKIAQFVNEHPETHYSRYSDDILLSSEETDDDSSLNALFDLVKDELKALHLEINPQKLQRIKLSYQEHNSLSYLGLGISKLDDIDNKVTISKRYILFLLSLIKKNKIYGSKCKGLLDEINSRVAYLAYNSPVSYARFQKKHLNMFGEEYRFTPRKPLDRVQPILSNELPDFGEYQKVFEFEIHDKISNTEKYGFTKLDAITIKKYTGKEEVVRIPKFVDSIGERAFYCSNVKEVIFEGNIKQIGKEAFCRCYRLEKIELPKSLRFIGNGAFDNCAALKNIVVPEKVKAINPFTFAGSGLESIVLPEGLKEVRSNAFENCSKLREIVLPNNVEALCKYAFNHCSRLERVVLPDSLLKIDDNAFSNCSRLTDIHLPASLLEIEDEVFANCSRLKAIALPDYLGSIGRRVFDGCPLLNNINTGKNTVFSMNKNGDLIETKTGYPIIFRSKIIDPNFKIVPAFGFSGSQIKSITIPEGIVAIGQDAFKSCTLLKEVKLPSTLKTISIGAFSDCISLKEIIIPEGVKVIPQRMLAGCTRLEKVVLPEGLLTIEEDAFSNDQLLKDINIPHSVNKIGKHAFKYCYGIKDLYLSENAKKVHKKAFYGCSYSLESIKVSPLNTIYTSGQNTNTLIVRKTGELVLGCQNSYVGDDVNIIYNHAFVNCLGLKKIELSKSTTIIQKGAFKGCLNLEKVDLGNVYTIESEAFAGDEKITQIVLPESLTKLGDKAFAGTNIKVLRIPASLGDYVLNSQTFNFESIEELYISSTMRTLTNGKDDNFFFPNLKKVVVDKQNHFMRSDVNGKETNTIMITRAFRNKETFENEEKCVVLLGSNNALLIDQHCIINSNAFKGLNHLKKIHIGKDVELNNGCFQGCKNLKEVVIDSSKPRTLPDSIFMGCTSLEKVVLNGVETIGKQAFANCEALKSITLSKELKAIYLFAFVGCSSLKEIIVPNKIEELSTATFMGCSKLESVSLPKGLKKIGKLAFKGCQKLKRIDIPNTVKEIGIEAFSNCEALKEAILPNSLVKIEAGAFSKCRSLETIELGDKIVEIGQHAFQECVSLKRISLPKKLETIEYGTFEKCDSLEQVLMQSKVKSIKNDAFSDCKALKDIALSSALNEIGSAFRNCVSLKEIVLPDSVKVIYYSCFAGCSSLKTINMPKNLEKLGESAFEGTAIDSLECNKELSSIDDNCFLNCKKLKKADLSKAAKLSVVSKGAFRNCSSLSEVLLPKKLIQIGKYSFAQCPKLKGIKLPETVDAIKEGAFAFDTGIKEIYIPRDLTIFNNSAFFGCGIEKISINKSNKIFKVINGNTLMVNKVIEGDKKLDLNSILLATPKTVISDDAEYLMSYSFNDAYKGQKELVMPANVAIVGNSAFASWNQLKHLSFLGNRNLQIGSSSFCNAPLKGFDIPNNTYSVGSCAFNAVAPTHLHLSKDMKNFSIYAFNNSKLKEIIVDKDNSVYASLDSNILVKKEDNRIILSCPNSKIPEGIERVESFSNAEIYDEVFIPQSLENVTGYSFGGVMVKKFVINKDNPYFMSNDDGSALIARDTLSLIHYSKDGILPEGIKSVGYIELNKTAKKLYIPSTLTDINSIIRLNTSNIEEIEVSKDNPYFDSRNGCNAIIDSRTNKLLVASKNMIIPEDVTTIGASAFANRGIKDVFIPKQINYINTNAFDSIGRINSIKVDPKNAIFAVSDDGHDLIIKENYVKSAGKRAKHFVLTSDPIEEQKEAELKDVFGFEYDGLTSEERRKNKDKKSTGQSTNRFYLSLSDTDTDDMPF